MISKIRKGFAALGPGMLYAGAAVGVSHLIMATKAGAIYHFLLIALIPIIHLIKYPFYEFGPRYTAATGHNILHGYRALGKWALWTYILMTLATMCIIQGAVTIVTASIAVELFNLSQFGINGKLLALVLLIISQFMLVSGHYKFLNKMMKVIIIFLTITTIFAVGSILFSHPSGLHQGVASFSITNATDAIFLAAFLGWMPAPMDISVWHSVWSEEHNQGKSGDDTVKASRFDFNVGFIGTAFLAMCFLALGALVMFGSGETPSPKGAVFSGQLIKMYTAALGPWAYYLIGAAALTTMFSTTLTCLDAYPRTLEESFQILKGADKNEHDQTAQKIYTTILSLTLIGTSIIYLFFMQNMGQMIRIATIIAFIAAPIIAIINYLAIKGDTVPEEHRPSKLMHVWSITSIIILVLFSLWFLCI